MPNPTAFAQDEKGSFVNENRFFQGIVLVLESIVHRDFGRHRVDNFLRTRNGREFGAKNVGKQSLMICGQLRSKAGLKVRISTDNSVSFAGFIGRLLHKIQCHCCIVFAVMFANQNGVICSAVPS
jgi:hypothetical protein